LIAEKLELYIKLFFYESTA